MCAQSCLTFRDPMGCSPTGSSVHGIFQARILEWVAMSYSRGSSPPRDWNHISWVSCIGRQILSPLSYLGLNGHRKEMNTWLYLFWNVLLFVETCSTPQNQTLITTHVCHPSCSFHQLWWVSGCKLSSYILIVHQEYMLRHTVWSLLLMNK